MEIKIYDFENNEVSVKLPVEKVDDIIAISVDVVSGDEIVEVTTKNGSVTADSSNNRLINLHDGSYVLETKEAIKEWMSDVDYRGLTISYNRMR